MCLQRMKRSADSQVVASAACASGVHFQISQGQLPFDRTDNPLLRNKPVHSPGHIAEEENYEKKRTHTLR